MPGRKYSAGSVYRYGFNGKENDNELKGEGNQQDYGMRIYDPRLGKFLSVDPLTKEYPELTPYQFASNRPIDGIDMDGLEYSPAGRYGNNQLAVDATAIQHYPADPLMLRRQVAEAPERQRIQTAKVIRETVIRQVQPVMRQYREPDLVRQTKNKTLAANYKATHPEQPAILNNKHYQKFAENVAVPMIEGLVFEGAGRLVFRGLGNLFSTRTIYRTIDAIEANSINTSQKLSFGPNGAEMKQFWTNKTAYNTYLNAADGSFANGFKLEVKVPKSLIGQEKILNTSTQVDDFLFKQGTTNSATVNGQSALEKLNKSIKGIKITKELD